MPDGAEPGSLIADTEDVYRAILSPEWWPDGMVRPSSAAFDEAVFSVDVKSRTTPQATAARFRNVTRIAEFNCGQAKGIGFETRDELDPNQPENLAHAHVYFLGYDTFSRNERKKKARKLAELCVEVAVPAPGSAVVFVERPTSIPSSQVPQGMEPTLGLPREIPVASDGSGGHDAAGFIRSHRAWLLIALALFVLALLWVLSR